MWKSNRSFRQQPLRLPLNQTDTWTHLKSFFKFINDGRRNRKKHHTNATKSDSLNVSLIDKVAQITGFIIIAWLSLSIRFLPKCPTETATPLQNTVQIVEICLYFACRTHWNFPFRLYVYHIHRQQERALYYNIYSDCLLLLLFLMPLVRIRCIYGFRFERNHFIQFFSTLLCA